MSIVTRFAYHSAQYIFVKVPRKCKSLLEDLEFKHKIVPVHTLVSFFVMIKNCNHFFDNNNDCPNPECEIHALNSNTRKFQIILIGIGCFIYKVKCPTLDFKRRFCIKINAILSRIFLTDYIA